jgi:5-methylcytosine-specific restriction endonuclease McrA
VTPYDSKHRALRDQVLVEEPFCVGYPIGIHDGEPTRTTQLDHKKPLIEGGPTSRENAGGLCGPCNGRKGRDERRRTWRGR